MSDTETLCKLYLELANIVPADCKSSRELKLEALLSAAPVAPETGEAKCEGAAEAVIENGVIVIRLPIAHLPQVLEGGWLCHAHETRWKLTDVPAFAKDFVAELNRQDEEGSTPIHKMFDAAIEEAINQGAQGIEEHEDQEP